MQEGPPRREVHRLVDVGIRPDDIGGVAAELEVRPLQVAAGQLADRTTGPRRPGEGDHAHPRVGDHRLADLGSPGDELQEPCGQARLLEDAHHRHTAGDHGAGVGLEQHGVSQRESRRDGADAEDQRHVERGDHADDADRDLLCEREPRLLAGEDRAQRSRKAERRPRSTRRPSRAARSRRAAGSRRPRGCSSRRSRRHAAPTAGRPCAARPRGQGAEGPPTPSGRALHPRRRGRRRPHPRFRPSRASRPSRGRSRGSHRRRR